LRNSATQFRWRYPRTTQARYVAKLSGWQKYILKKLWHWEADLDAWLETHPGDTACQTVKRFCQNSRHEREADEEDHSDLNRST
jgi:hypothetical protein